MRNRLLVALAVPMLAMRASAQILGGSVVGDSSRRPLAGIRVQLVDSATAAVVDSARTDSTGLFYANAPRAGVYSLRFLRVDAVPRGSNHWHLGADAFEQASFVLPEGLERTAYLSLDLDRSTAPMPRNPAPRYPAAFRDKGISGNVRAQFIVDTTGRVVVESVKIIFATAEEFGDAVRAVVGEWKFFPAQKGGAAVRQLVCMPMTFRLDHGDTKALDAQWAEWYAHPACPLTPVP